MLKEVAIARLQRMVAYDVDPQLAALDLEYLLNQARRVDDNGRVYTDPDWVATYNLNFAAARGWELKAAKCSNRFNFSSDVNSFQRKQTFDNCIKMAETYNKRGGNTTMELSADYMYDPVIGNLGG